MTTALVERPAHGMTPDQVDLIKRTIAKGASNDELSMFLAQCQKTGLDPFSRQIYWIKRGNQGSTQVSIDGFRVIAERSGEMDGQEVHWCGDDGAWVDVWLQKTPPAAARVLVYRKGCTRPFPGIAKWNEYNAGGNMWTKMPANQLAKCAEALALRKAFPHQLSGLYTTDEMGQADNGNPPPLVVDVKPERPAPPDGYVYIEKVEPKRKGNFEWANVTTSRGELLVASGQQQIALLEQMAQEGVPVDFVTEKNAKDMEVIKEAHRYQAEPPAVKDGSVADGKDLPF